MFTTNHLTERIQLEEEISNPFNLPAGCFFHTGCRYCIDKCKKEEVEFIEKEPEHFVACHLAKELYLQRIVHMIHSL